MYSLQDLVRLNSQWFAKGNSKFFGDLKYWALRGQISNKTFLVRSTYKWSDMFGQPKKLCFCINTVDDTGKIGDLLDQEFKTLDEAKKFLKYQ